MTVQRMTFGRAVLAALADPVRYLGGGPTTGTTNTYTVTDAPAMLLSNGGGKLTFRPTKVVVDYRNGRFHRMRISGPAPGHAGYKVVRRFDRERDVPEWAHKYLGENI
ncbi:hypothetical protein [Micromonospora sp. NPDC005174]|uniref:hypothetical protein n=1 Tax=Micromonospora sp. NPDC005174 TaxID=3157018 RepID=UPI0033AD9372